MVLNQKKLLVVDDEFSIYEAIALLFSGKYRVEYAANGEEALSRLGDEDLSAVLIDRVMPGALDGVAATRQIHLQRPGVKIIAMSAILNEEVIKEWQGNGASLVLQKPLDAKVLMEAVNEG